MAIDRERYLTADVAGETFLLDDHTGESFRLGGSGPRLWDLMATGSTIADAARVVTEETHADYERVFSDARQFVRHLADLGIDLEAEGDNNPLSGPPE